MNMEELIRIVLDLPAVGLFAWLYYKEREARIAAQQALVDHLKADNANSLAIREKEVVAKTELTTALNRQTARKRNT